MSLSSIPFVILVSVLLIFRRVNARSPFYEWFFLGLPFFDTPRLKDVDDVLAAPSRADARQRLSAVFSSASARAWTSQLSLHEMHFLEDAAFISLLGLSVCVAVASVGVYECASGTPLSWHVDALLVAAVTSSLSALVRAQSSLPWESVETKIAISLGALAAVLSGLAFFFTHESTVTPLLDLGAAPALLFRSSAAGATSTRSPWSTVAFLSAALGAFVGVVSYAVVQPALRIARFYSDKLQLAAQSPRPRFFRALHRTWFYAPALVAASWLRVFGGDNMLPLDATPCSATDSWRDCRSSLPGESAAGGRSWAGLLPTTFISNFSTTYAAHLGSLFWVSESSWLRLRAAAAFAVAATLVFLVRGHVRMWLATSRAAQEQVLLRALRKLTKEGGEERRVPLTVKDENQEQVVLVSKASVDLLRDVLRDCALERRKVLAIAPMLLTQILSVPLLIGALTLLLVRVGGLGGFGICDAARAAVGAELLPAVDGKNFLSFLPLVLSRVIGADAKAMADADKLRDAIAVLIAPPVWRPILSFVVFAVLAVLFIEFELALLFWRVSDNAQEEEEWEAAQAEKSTTVASMPAGASVAQTLAAAIEEFPLEEESKKKK